MVLRRNIYTTGITLFFFISTTISIQVQHQVTNNTSQHTTSNIRDINLHELDERIRNILQDPDKYNDQGSQLLQDVSEFYSYLGEMTDHIDRNNNLHLLRIILTHPPEFITAPCDEERLSSVFSWTQDQLEDFNRVFQGSFLLWQRLEGMGKSLLPQ